MFQDSAPVVTATEPCADISKAKEICLAEVRRKIFYPPTEKYLHSDMFQGGDCTELMKSFEECMNNAQS